MKLTQPEKAILSNKKSFTINKKLSNDIEIAKNYKIFGDIYYYQANYVESVRNHLESNKICEKLKLNELEQLNYSGLAQVSHSQKEYNKALKYIFKAIDLEKQKPNDLRKANNYIILGETYGFLKKNKLAENNFLLASKILTKKNKLFAIAHVLMLRSNLYYEIDPLKAIQLQMIAQKTFDKIAPNSINSAYNIVYLGESLFELAKNDSLIKEINYSEIPRQKIELIDLAEEYYKRGLVVTKLNKNADGYLTTTSLISDLQAYKGDYKNAYSNLQSKITFSDSLFSQKNKNAIAKLESEKELLKLKSANEKKATLNKILIASSISLLLIGFLGYRNFRNKQNLQNLKITELEKDKQLLAIDAMLKGQEEERGRIAKDLHDGLGGLLSGTKLSFTNMKENLILTPENATQFDKSLNMLDTTIADLRKVAHNLMPESLVKFGLNDALRDFCNSIQSSSSIIVEYQKMGIDRKIDNTAETFIYRIIQELVNNAVKHASAKEIMVQLTVENAKVLITVEDDGKGYDKNQTTKGDGLDNIAFRVNYLKGKIDTETSPNKGTSVNIELNA
jgi:two-component system, NarL family, sensor kinase